MQRMEVGTPVRASRDHNGEVLSNANLNPVGENWEPPKGQTSIWGRLWGISGEGGLGWVAGMNVLGEILAPKRMVSHSPQNSSLPLWAPR